MRERLIQQQKIDEVLLHSERIYRNFAFVDLRDDLFRILM